MPGLQAWSVVGRIGLTGLKTSVSKLKAFDAAGEGAASTLISFRKAANIAGAASIALGGAVAAGVGGMATKSFADFDEAMQESLAIMDVTSERMRNKMAGAAREVARTTTFSAKEAAEGYFFLASAGMDAADSLKALPEVAKFAQAGNFNLARATELATDAQSAMGLKSEDTAKNIANLKKVMDNLVKANQQANATVEQFSEALTNRAAAAARSFNIPMEETLAVLQVFADQGRKGRRAGTQLARFLRITAEGAAENRKQFENMGLIDARGNLNSLAQIIQGLTQHLRGMSDSAKTAELKALGFTARVQAAIKPLLGMSDAVREYAAGQRAANRAVGEVKTKQLNTLNKQLGLVVAKVKDFFRSMAPMKREVVGPLRAVNRSLELVIKTWGEWQQIATGQKTGDITEKLNSMAASLQRNRFQIVAVVEKVRFFLSMMEGFLVTFGSTFFKLVQIAFDTGQAIGFAFEAMGSTIVGHIAQAVEDSVNWMRRMVEKANVILPSALEFDLPTLESSAEGFFADAEDRRARFRGELRSIRGHVKDLVDVFGEEGAEIRRAGKRAIEAQSIADFPGAGPNLLPQRPEGEAPSMFPLDRVEKALFPNLHRWDQMLNRAELFMESARMGTIIPKAPELGGGGGGGGGRFGISSPEFRRRGRGFGPINAMIPQVPRIVLDELKPPAGQSEEEAGGPTVGLAQGPMAQVIRQGRRTKKKLQRLIAQGFSLKEAAETIGVSTKRAGQLVGRNMEKGMKSRLIRSGQRAITGLVQGLKNGASAGSIISQIASIGATIAGALIGAPGIGRAVGGLFGALGIGSPAERGVFAGRMVGEGLTLGMEEKVEQVQRASGRLADAASVHPSASVGGRLRARANRMSANRSVRVDTSGMPPAKDPRQAARDREWKDFLEMSGKALREDGVAEFQPARA